MRHNIAATATADPPDELPATRVKSQDSAVTFKPKSKLKYQKLPINKDLRFLHHKTNLKERKLQLGFPYRTDPYPSSQQQSSQLLTFFTAVALNSRR